MKKTTPWILLGIVMVGVACLFMGMPCEAADATVTIYWRDDHSASGDPSGTPFSTNVTFYVENVGDPKTVEVQPQSGFYFSKGPKVSPGTDQGVTVAQAGNAFTVTIVNQQKEGSVHIEGTIMRNPAGGGGGVPPHRDFDISVLQQWDHAILTTNGTSTVGITNLTVCAGTTNDITTAVIMGNMAAPVSGQVAWSVTPASLGSFTANNVALAGGKASTKFIASTEGGSGTMMTTATQLKDANNISIPNATTNLTVNLPKVDLDAMKVNHNAANGELADADEEQVGAFVPLNNDDDDYDANNRADKDQNGAIAGENDLLPIVLHKIDLVSLAGKYKLVIPNEVKIWKKNDRTEQVDAATEIDATADTTLYVEGIAKGNGMLKVNWSDGTTTLNDCDRVKITVFEWLGPLNVPSYAIYNYTATGALGSSKWITPIGGTIKTGADTSNVTILWGEGPAVGKAVYQANANYIWDLDVNVVQIKIFEGGNRATYGIGRPYQDPGPGSAFIVSSRSPYAMTVRIRIEKVEGPTVGGSQRGKKFLELGLVHQAQFDAKHGLYNDTIPKKRRTSNLEDGKLHWDAAEAATIPWTFLDADHYLNITSDFAAVSNVLFWTYDRPEVLATDQFILNGDQVDTLGIIMPHRLYFAVRLNSSAPNVNNSRDVLTRRGQLNWKFDGTGNVDGRGRWSLTGSGVTGDAEFVPIRSGIQVPSAEPNLNDLLPLQIWTTGNQ